MLGIYALQKFSTLDFPNRLAAILWFSGCNMRCPYCYNPDIVFGKKKLEEKEVLDFLKRRVGFLDGVVFTGGEATLYPNLYNFAKEIKNMGYEIKLDTNGLKPYSVYRLVEDRLVDYIALDYKAPKEKFEKITSSKKFEDFEKTLQYLIDKNFNFEVRTTIHTDLLDESDINKIINDLKKRGYKGTYYLQNFFDVEKTLGNISPQKRKLDISKLDTAISLEFRNF
jgi:pyruvate formate lyase activating enzyme